jgi:hypothetical protein
VTKRRIAREHRLAETILALRAARRRHGRDLDPPARVLRRDVRGDDADRRSPDETGGGQGPRLGDDDGGGGQRALRPRREAGGARRDHRQLEDAARAAKLVT